jgi:hypothetical protein
MWIEEKRAVNPGAAPELKQGRGSHLCTEQYLNSKEDV